MPGSVFPYVGLITSEHQDKPNFMAMVSASFQPLADLIALYQLAPALYDLDQAIGAQLDVLGEWIGISRNLNTPITGTYFAMDTPNLGFDQGVWLGPYNPGTEVISLPDDYYRLLLKVRIINNQWNGSAEGAYRFAGQLFNAFGYQFQINDPCNQTITLQLIGPSPTPPMLVALLTGGYLDLRPSGVQITNYIYP